MMFYERFPSDYKIKGMLILNISLDWFKEVFGDRTNSASKIMFLESDGRVLYHSDIEKFKSSMANDPIYIQLKHQKNNDGYMKVDTEMGTFLVFYSKSDLNSLYLLRQYPYEVVMGGLIRMRKTTGLLVMGFIFGAILLATVISRKLYKPIRQLTELVRKQGSSTYENQGELNYLSNSIDTIINSNVTLTKISSTYRNLLQVDVIRELLQGKFHDKDKLNTIFREYGIPFNVYQSFTLVGFKSIPMNDCELLENRVEYFLVPFSTDGKITIILTQQLNDELMDQLCNDLFSCGSSLLVLQRMVSSVLSIAATTIAIMEELHFSFLYGNHTVKEIISSDRDSSDTAYPSINEEALLQALHQGTADCAFEQYEDFFSKVSVNAFSHFRFCMKRLYLSVNLQFLELQKHSCFFDYKLMTVEEFEEFLSTLADKESLDSFFRALFIDFCEEVLQLKRRKILVIAEKMKELTEESFQDQNLCIAKIADAVELSASYAAKIFKDCLGISWADYCMEYRMSRATELLISHEYSVKEIASAVGFANENYFYTLFKKIHGVTPNEFRKQQRL